MFKIFDNFVKYKDFNELVEANNNAYGMIKELCPHKKVEHIGCECYACELCKKVFYKGKPKGSKVKTEVYK